MEKNQGLYKKVQGLGSPILMIHGIISDSSFFEDSVSYLSKKYRVMTYDRRSYGKSNRKEYKDYSVHTQAEDAAAILREFCHEPAWIVGNSAGGLIAIELALSHPELVRGMILIEPSLGYEERERKKLLDWNKELNEYVAADRIKLALPAFARVVGGTSKTNQTTSLNETRQTYQNLSAFMHGELNEVQNYLPPIENLKKLSMPIVVAVTEEGRQSIFATSSLSGAKMTGWPVEWIPGFHNMAKELPEQFSEKIFQIVSQYAQ